MAYAAKKSVEADDTPGPVIEMQPDRLIDEIPAGVDYKKLLADEVFMSEPVGIILHPLGQEENEPAVPVSVNGDRVSITPGVLTRVKRYHVSQLLKARTHSRGY